MYTWLIYNTATGAIGIGDSTHSPMWQTVVVTVNDASGTQTSNKTTTSHTQNVEIGTTTTTSTDKETGDVTTTTTTIAFDPSLVSSGFALIGVFDDAHPMDSATQAAFSAPQAFLYQSGAFTDNANWPTVQLSQAQKKQISDIEIGYQTTLNGGFISSANGTATLYGYAQSDVQHMNMIASGSALNIETWPIDYADMQANIVRLTQAQFTALVTTASKFNWAQITQMRSLIGQVQASTTVSAVQAIVWVAAAY